MPFATDRDLLILEPTLYRDIAWAGQRRINVTDAVVVGAVLTSATADFIAADIKPGHVALLNATALEVVSRDSATQLTVSLIRDDTADVPLAPPAATAAALVITTFGPQITTIHDQLLRALGIEPADPTATPNQNNITNPQAVAHLESLGALHLVFAAAAALATNQDTLWAKAQNYRDRFVANRNRLAVGVDLDNDGLPDATRRLNTIQFIRA